MISQMSTANYLSDKSWTVPRKDLTDESSFDIWRPQDSTLNTTVDTESYFSLFGGWPNSASCSSPAPDVYRELQHRVNPHAVMKVIGAGGSIIRRVQAATQTLIVSPHRSQADKVFRISARHPDPLVAMRRVTRAQALLQTLEDVTMLTGAGQVRHPELLPRVHWLLDETAEQTGLTSPMKQLSPSASSSPTNQMQQQQQLNLTTIANAWQQQQTGNNRGSNNWLLANQFLRELILKMDNTR